MHYAGVVFDWLEQDGTVREAILTADRASIDWEEEGEVWHLEADSDGQGLYRGNYGPGRLDRDRTVELKRFDAADGEVVLLGVWRYLPGGDTGTIIFRLTPASRTP